MQEVRSTSVRDLARLLTGWRVADGGARTLADRIGLLLEDGRLVAGGKLPAERALADALGISRTTVSAAYALLRERRLLRTVHGSGSVLVRAGTRPHGEPPVDGIADLSNAVPPAWPGLLSAVERAAARLPSLLPATRLDYTGLVELRERIAHRFAVRGLATTPDQVLVTMGAQHGLGLLVGALARRADRLVLDVPSYPHAIDGFRAAGLRLIPVGMPHARPDIGGWERVLAASRPELAYLMPDFHNPTGAVLAEEERRRLLRAAAASGTVLIVDETTAELAIDPAPARPPFAALAVGSGAEVITLGSVGKTIWHGLRIGWIRADRRTIAAIAAARPARDLGTPVLEQLVVSELLPAMPDVLRDRAERLGATRAAVLQRLGEELPDWAVPVPSGGLCLWAELPDARSSALVAAAAREGLQVIAGPRFGLDGAFERRLRIPITGAPAASAEAIELLARAWRATVPGATHFDASAPVF